MIHIFSKLLPHPIKRFLRSLRNQFRAMFYKGSERYCPVCERTFRAFIPSGNPERQDARCPNCDALERHRLVWMFMNNKTDLFDRSSKLMLHVAPEVSLFPRLKKKLGKGYLTADQSKSRAMIQMDITNIDSPEESFDVIYCSHVLEHVQDDKQAMREFYRVLKCKGWAILLVPITVEKTFEDPSITDPEERLKAFGQEDHVRAYGADFIDRLRDAEFNVKKYGVLDLGLKQDDIIRMGLTPAAGDIFFCTKQCGEA